jgi:hypothetical protein
MSDNFYDEMTLGEARAELRTLVDEGATCPCCTQFAKVYKRKIHSMMAYELIVCWRTAGAEWFHLPTIAPVRGGDFGKLRYWGLVVEEIERRPDGGRSGWWHITPAGADWILHGALVQKYARIYDGRCLSFEGEPVSIRDALGDKFRYDELMAEA